MKFAGKYMMEEFAPQGLVNQADPSIEISKTKGDFSAASQSPARIFLSAYPLFAFNAQGLGFTPGIESF